jgi:hypothetical protein
VVVGGEGGQRPKGGQEVGNFGKILGERGDPFLDRTEIIFCRKRYNMVVLGPILHS